MLLHHLLNEVLQFGIGEVVDGLLTLGAQKFFMAERVLDIEQFLGTHDNHLRKQYVREAGKYTCVAARYRV